MDEFENQHKYLSCFIILQSYYLNDYKNIANMMITLAHLNHQQLQDKLIYENLEHCINSISNADSNFVIQNVLKEAKIASKIPSYTLSQSIMSPKLGNPVLTPSQSRLRNYFKEEFEDELILICNKVEQKLKELVSGSPQREKRSQYSNDRDQKISQAVLWTLVIIGVTVLASIVKVLFDKNRNKMKKAQVAMMKAQKVEKKNKKKEKIAESSAIKQE